MNRLFNYVLILLLGLNSLSAVTQKKIYGDYIKLSVFNTDGRFLLFGRNDTKDKWQALIFEDYPSTSFFRFYDQDNEIPFGYSSLNYQSESNIIDNVIKYYWQNKQIRITLVYQLISSQKNKPLDMLELNLYLENLRDQDYEIQFLFCIDTYLGEQANKHFILPGNIVANTETEILGPALTSSINTYHEKKQLGLNLLFDKDQHHLPDRVYLTNWKRAESKMPLFKVVEGRQYDLKPYSINDSAIVIEYKKVPLSYLKREHFRFLLQMVPGQKQTRVIAGQKKSGQKTEPASKRELANLSLAELLALLNTINEKLESGGKIAAEDVEYSRKILDEIKKRQ